MSLKTSCKSPSEKKSGDVDPWLTESQPRQDDGRSYSASEEQRCRGPKREDRKSIAAVIQFSSSVPQRHSLSGDFQ